MGGPTGVFIKNRIVVSIKPDQPATFHDSVDWMYQVACFLSMAAGRAQGIDHIHVTTTEVIDDIPQSLTIRPSYRWKASDKSEKHKPHPGDVPLDPIQHRAEFDAVLADWIGRHSGWRVARSRYLDCIRKANKYGPERTFPSNPDASSKETIIQDIHSCPDTPHPGAVSETRPGKQLPLVMRWARDERCLSQACQAVLEFMQRHPIRHHLGTI